MTPTGLEAELPALRSQLMRHARLVVRDAALAEDLVQDTLLAVVQQHAERRGDAKLATWAIAILKNKVADWYRSPQSWRLVPLQDDSDALGEAVDGLYSSSGHYAETVPAWQQPDNRTEQKQMMSTLEGCMACLPTQTGRVFMMREWLGFESSEICTRLKISPENCRTLLHRARMGLRLCMEKNWLGQKAAAGMAEASA